MKTNVINFWKKYIVVAMVALIVCFSIVGAFVSNIAFAIDPDIVNGGGSSSSSSGTSSDLLSDLEPFGDKEYKIKNISDWNTFRDYVNDGYACEELTFILTSDLDLSSKGDDALVTGVFKGTLDGKFYSIEINTTQNSSSSSSDEIFVGLFKSTNSAKFKNITVKGSIKSTPATVGGLVAKAENTDFQYCFNRASVTGNCAGGIVGEMVSGKLDQCANYGSITGVSYAGGIVGEADEQSIITNCYNRGDICFSNNHQSCYMGGIVGYSDGTVEMCYNTFISIYSDAWYTTSLTYSCHGDTGIWGYLGVKDSWTTRAYIYYKKAYYFSDINGGRNSTVVSCYGVNTYCEDGYYPDNYVKCEVYEDTTATMYDREENLILPAEGESNSTRIKPGNEKINFKITAQKLSNYIYYTLDISHGGESISIMFPFKNTRNHTAVSLEDLKSLPAGLTAVVWAVDPNINDGYPYLKNMYWTGDPESPDAQAQNNSSSGSNSGSSGSGGSGKVIVGDKIQQNDEIK